MSDYGTMQTAIANEISRGGLSAEIKTAIQNAMTFYENDRFWVNEAEWTINTVADQEAYGLPLNYQEADILTYTVSGDRDPIQRRTYDWYRTHHVNTNTRANRPTDWTIYADQLWLYPTPDAAYLLTLSGQKSPDALAADGDTNYFMTDGELLIRWRAKAHLYRHVIKDYKQAGQMDGAEAEAMSNLTTKTTRRNATGTVRPTQF